MREIVSWSGMTHIVNPAPAVRESNATLLQSRVQTLCGMHLLDEGHQPDGRRCVECERVAGG